MKAIAARCLPIPESIDLFFLDQEYPATDTPALDAVFEVDSCVEIFVYPSEVVCSHSARSEERIDVPAGRRRKESSRSGSREA